MRLRNLASVGLLLIVLSACRIPLRGGVSSASTPTADITVTLTPFQPGASETALPISANATPLPAGSTSNPTALTPSITPTPARTFPTPQITPASTRIPLPVDVLAKPARQLNVLYMGANKSLNSKYRTDVMILVTLRPDGSVSLVSFPRDLYVYLPGRQMDRLSAAMGLGGFEMLRSTFDYNFGFLPDEYLVTDYEGYQAIIDTMGGIDVHVAKTFQGAREGYPKGYTVNAGLVHMDGATAFWYVLARSPADDLDRMRRSQEVLIAMGEKLFSLDALTHMTQIYTLFRSNVDTNLNLGTTLELLPRMLKVDSKKVNRYSIGYGQVTPWVDPITKAQYLLPKPEAIRQLLQQAIGIP